jgi:hypothetical protein
VRALILACLLLLPLPAAAQPKQCRSYSDALNACNAELKQYEPVLMPAMTASVALGETITLTLVVPPGDRYEFATAGGDWDFADISGGYLVTFTPETLGTFRAVYRVLRQGQLEEYPVVVTVGSTSSGSTAPESTTASLTAQQLTGETYIRVAWVNVGAFATTDRIEVWAPNATQPSDRVVLGSPPEYVVVESLGASGSIKYWTWSDPSLTYEFRYYRGTTLIARTAQVSIN